MDLSSFFCDWLDLEITDTMRQKEIIENCSLNRSRDFYYQEMRKAFQQMYDCLKYERWMTLVYAHKDTEYWDAIISACQDAGFDFVNAVYEKPKFIWSMIKKKNKATTFSGELYLNFKKSRTAKGKLIHTFKNDFKPIIKNTVELAIVHNNGCATMEDIISELIPVLARHGLAGKFQSEKIDIKAYMDNDFAYNDRQNGYELPPNRRLSSFVPIEDRVLFYVKDYLISENNNGKAASFDQIIAHVLPNLVNGNIPSRESILDVLHRIAVQDIHGNWMLSEEGSQMQLPIPISICVPKKEPKASTHNLLIWKLLFMGNKGGMSPYLAKKERGEKEIRKGGMPFLSSLNIKATPAQLKKIEQIDVIWTDKGNPIYAFEVEESTSIISAFERFLKLMEVCPDLSSKKNLILVVPKRRKRKLKDVFTNSGYIGHPLYLENKVRFIFSEDLQIIYEQVKNHYFKLNDLEKYLKRFDEL